MKLTKWQIETMDAMINAVNCKNRYLVNSRDFRNVGKTIMINHLALNLMADGYTVYLYSLNGVQEYYADVRVDKVDVEIFRGIRTDKVVVIVDEWQIDNLAPMVEYCTDYNIPIVGFAF